MRAERALRLVPAPDEVEVGASWFCGYCAAPALGGGAPAPDARVCGKCGLGLMLEARGDAVPQPREAFLVVDCSLLVQAVSRHAERMLAVSEEQAVNRPVADLLVAADADAHRRGALAEAIITTLDGDEPRHAFARPWNTFGMRVRVRIAACGPPRAALLVLDAPTRRLRPVAQD